MLAATVAAGAERPSRHSCRRRRWTTSTLRPGRRRHL